MAHLIQNNFGARMPWQTNSVEVKQGESVEALAKRAGLGWDVELRPLAIAPVVDGPWKHGPMRGFRGVMRNDTEEVFCVPTAKYKAVKNLEILRFFEDFTNAGLCELTHVGALAGGRKVFALAKMKTGAGVVAGCENDTQLGHVLLATSHDGSLKTMAVGTAVYGACWNTLQSSLYRLSKSIGGLGRVKNVFSLRHTAKFDNAAKQRAARTVELVGEQMEGTLDMANDFASVELDDRGRAEFIRRLLGGESALDMLAQEEDERAAMLANPEGLLDEVLERQFGEGKKPEDTRVGKALATAMVTAPGQHLASRSNTLWGAVNGVTYYVDHERGRSQDSTLNAAWFGQGAQLKAEAVRVAYDLKGRR